MHDDGAPRRAGEQVAQWAGGQDRGDLRAERGTEPAGGRGIGVPQPRGHRVKRGPRPGGRLAARGRPRGRRGALARRPDVPRGTIEQQRALGQHEVDVLADRHLDGGIVAPAGDGVAPCLHPEMPQPGRGHHDLGAVAVGALGQLAHGGQRPAAAVRAAQHGTGAEHLVSLAEHGRADFKGFPDDGLGGTPPALHRRLHVEDRNAAYHPATLPIGARLQASRLP